MARYFAWCACPECEGSGRVWEHLKGAGVMQTTTCWRCWGFGEVRQEISREQMRKLMDADEAKEKAA